MAGRLHFCHQRRLTEGRFYTAGNRGYKPVMLYSLADLSTLSDLPFDEIIDVRSPAEFAEDHLPGAINLPVLDDEQRAQVGTIYVQDDPFRARKIGAALVARNAARHIDGPLADRQGGWRPLVYCWRGGQRSNSFASILKQIGWRVGVLEGGYQTYRRLVVARLYDTPVRQPVVLLDGNTGTAKTALLQRVRTLGGQIIDLEGLAQHRGSVFGLVGAKQPSQKMFESRLADALRQLDPNRPVLLEAESNRIGNCAIPAAVWRAMCAAPRIRLAATPQSRADFLTTAYSDVTDDIDRLETRIEALRRFHSADTISRWLAWAREGAFRPLALELMEQHYDPRYAKSQARSAHEILGEIRLAGFDESDLDRAAEQILELASGFRQP